eukprot:GHVU01225155.1.p1 GENE.GHVU01225155.1~~GHVU01225155.1.p1  ORF type:complete len:100 (-),score=5.78 GHVU01225155.1:177-476(-)
MIPQLPLRLMRPAAESSASASVRGGCLRGKACEAGRERAHTCSRTRASESLKLTLRAGRQRRVVGTSVMEELTLRRRTCSSGPQSRYVCVCVCVCVCDR